VWEALRVSLADGFYLPVRATLGENGAVPVGWYGQQDASWIAFYDGVQRLQSGRFPTDDAEHLDDWAMLARSCGWWWPGEQVCVVVDRPAVIDTEPVPGGLVRAAAAAPQRQGSGRVPRRMAPTRRRPALRRDTRRRFGAKTDTAGTAGGRYSGRTDGGDGMKLAEALAERAAATRRVEQPRARIVASARHQEGETPAEDAAALLAEAGTVLDELETLIRRINHTNATVPIGDDGTLTDPSPAATYSAPATRSSPPQPTRPPERTSAAWPSAGSAPNWP
jgi:hypothetical protein